VGTPKWLIAMGILVPLLTLMSVSIGMIISSRVNDVRLAEQLGGLLVLPVVGLTIPVLMGRLLLSAELFAAGAALIAMIDGGLLYLSVQLFQRETILIRWK
jgi:ABC-2 type transport system permease protein